VAVKHLKGTLSSASHRGRAACLLGFTLTMEVENKESQH